MLLPKSELQHPLLVDEKKINDINTSFKLIVIATCCFHVLSILMAIGVAIYYYPSNKTWALLAILFTLLPYWLIFLKQLLLKNYFLALLALFGLHIFIEFKESWTQGITTQNAQEFSFLEATTTLLPSAIFYLYITFLSNASQKSLEINLLSSIVACAYIAVLILQLQIRNNTTTPPPPTDFLYYDQYAIPSISNDSFPQDSTDSFFSPSTHPIQDPPLNPALPNPSPHLPFPSRGSITPEALSSSDPSTSIRFVGEIRPPTEASSDRILWKKQSQRNLPPTKEHIFEEDFPSDDLHPSSPKTLWKVLPEKKLQTLQEIGKEKVKQGWQGLRYLMIFCFHFLDINARLLGYALYWLHPGTKGVLLGMFMSGYVWIVFFRLDGGFFGKICVVPLICLIGSVAVDTLPLVRERMGDGKKWLMWIEGIRWVEVMVYLFPYVCWGGGEGVGQEGGREEFGSLVAGTISVSAVHFVHMYVSYFGRFYLFFFFWKMLDFWWTGRRV